MSLLLWLVFFAVSWSAPTEHRAAAAALALVPAVFATSLYGAFGLAGSLLATAGWHLGVIRPTGPFAERVVEVAPVLAAMLLVAALHLRDRRVDDELALRSTITDHVHEAVVAADTDGRIIYWNPAAETLYGWPATEVLGRPIVDVMPSPATTKQAEEIMATLRRGDVWQGEFQGRRKDGSSFSAHVSNAPMYARDGRFAGIVGISRDTTAEKEREAEARRAAEREKQMHELIEISRYKTDFLNNAAHELLTPLTPVDLQMDLLLAEKHGPLSDRQREVLQTVERNLQTLERTLSDIVDAAHAQKSPVALRRERFDLAEEAAQTVAYYEGLALRADVDLQVTARAPVVLVGDPMSLHRVLSTLIDNALRYSGAGGSVRVSVAEHDDAAIVRVEDDGQGIDPATADSLFEPFQHARIDDPRQGTGLGLYVAKTLVEAHGGKIWVEPRDQPGATVVFTVPRRLPLSEPAIASGEATPTVRAGH